MGANAGDFGLPVRLSVRPKPRPWPNKRPDNEIISDAAYKRFRSSCTHCCHYSLVNQVNFVYCHYPHRRCLFVFPHDISTTDETRITKLVVDTIHHEYWKPIYYWLAYRPT